MKKFLKRLWANEKGFTLIELIIVIAILAIIAAVAIPNILNAVDNSRKGTDIANARTIASAASTFVAQADDSSALAGTYIFSGGGVAAGTGVAATATDLAGYFNGNAPEPQYADALGTGADRFILTIGTDGAITVVAGDSATPPATVAVYPTPASAYDRD